MKLFINGSELAAAANIVSKALAINKNIPILEGMKISAYGKVVTLSAYNQELYIEKSIPAEILIEGEVVVGGKLFTEYMNKLSNEERISIEKDNNKMLAIGFGENKANITYFDIDNFPNIGEYDDENSFEIKENDLREVIDKVIYCVSNNDTRLLLKCCKLEVEDNNLTSVCSDGYRLAFSKKQISNIKGTFKSIILGKILADVSKILTDNEDYIKVCKCKNMVLIDLGHTKIKTNTVDIEFINYKNIIPKNVNTEITISKSDLERCLSRASIINRHINTNKVKVTVKDSTLYIYSEGNQCNTNESITCTTTGEEAIFGISSKFLIDAISRVKEDYVKIQIDSVIKPISIKSIDNEEYMSIILPVRLLS